MYVVHKFKLKFPLQNFLSTLWILSATPHTYGFWCFIEALFSILLNVFLKPFHLYFEAFCHHSFNLLKRSIPFKCFTFFLSLDCFSKSYQSFVILWTMLHVVFRFDLHHIQMDATHFLVAMGWWYNFQIWFVAHTNGRNPTFLLPMEC
jgi:hypothetical protein